MTCREFERRLWMFLDGELDGGTCAELRAHLEACPDCLNRYRFEGVLRKFIRRCCQEPVPETVRMRVIRFIAQITTGEP